MVDAARVPTLNTRHPRDERPAPLTRATSRERPHEGQGDAADGRRPLRFARRRAIRSRRSSAGMERRFVLHSAEARPMKFTLSWLKEHLATDASIDAIVETMTMTGLEVEGVENAGEKLGAFTVARIISAAKHPNADKLQVCQVETALGNSRSSAARRTRARASSPRSRRSARTIPGCGITLEAKPVRGVVSNGMLCSGAELELDTDADGILELDPRLKVGTPLAEALGLERSGDRHRSHAEPPRLAGRRRHRARSRRRRHRQANDQADLASARPLSLAAKSRDRRSQACPMFAGRFIRGVKNGPSPAWLQQKLRAIGQKPISALVDITNLITHDRAAPAARL